MHFTLTCQVEHFKQKSANEFRFHNFEKMYISAHNKHTNFWPRIIPRILDTKRKKQKKRKKKKREEKNIVFVYYLYVNTCC